MDIFTPAQASPQQRLSETIYRISEGVQNAANFLHFDKKEPYTPLQNNTRL